MGVTRESIRDIAYHEASHVVACILLKKKFSYVVLYRRTYKGMYGRVAFNGYCAALFPRKNKCRKKLWFERVIVMYLCGVVSDLFSWLEQENREDNKNPLLHLILLGKEPKAVELAMMDSQDNTDDCVMSQYLKCLGGISDDDFYGELYYRALNIYGTYFRAISQVAEMLLLKRKIKYFEVRDIVRSCGYLPCLRE